MFAIMKGDFFCDLLLFAFVDLDGLSFLAIVKIAWDVVGFPVMLLEGLAQLNQFWIIAESGVLGI